MNTIKVDIWSDIACPWCYIGKRRFEAALRDFEGRDDVVVEYHSFELDPTTPIDFEGSQLDYLVNHKGMDPAQIDQMLEQMTQVSAAEGLSMNFGALVLTNTLKAHELLHFAKAQGRQLEMAEVLFEAYFSKGAHVGRIPELASLAAEAGLDPEAATAALESGEYASAVSADIAQASEYGISGVPFFVVDGKYGISGAQPAEAFVQVLTQVAEEQAAARV